MRVSHDIRPFVALLLVSCGEKTKDRSGTSGDDPSGDTALSPPATDDDADGWDSDLDCDDADPEVHPDADERCDGLDNDCDGDIDESPVEGDIWYIDADGDGYGAGEGVLACGPGDGLASEATDCDDSDAAVNPGAEEVCNDLDDNCDGERLTGSPCALFDDCPLDVLVEFEAEDGTLTDLTANFEAATSAAPARLEISQNGTLRLCEGTWYAELRVTADWAAIVGVQGEDLSTLSSDAAVNVQRGALSIEGITFRDCSVGVTVFEPASLSVSASTFYRNAHGIYFGGTALTLRDVEILGNVEGVHGLGAGPIAVIDSEVRGNDAGLNQVGSGTLTLSGSSFTWNTSAVQSTSGDIEATDCIFSNNEAVGASPWGPALSAAGGDLTIDGCLFDGNANRADTGAIAGAVYSANGEIMVRDSLFDGNTAYGFKSNGWGGAIYSESGAVTLERVELTNNGADFGGAISMHSGDLVVSDSLIDSNVGHGGGASISASGSLRSTASVWTNNVYEDVEFGWFGSVNIGSDDYEGP